MRLKYVIFMTKHEIEVPVIFPELIEHVECTRIFSENKKELWGEFKAISAGFVNYHFGEIHCFGSSISLGLSSRGEIDSHIVKRFLIGE